jgi:DNA invertase Pin-like site-specific DNA recombinase
MDKDMKVAVYFRTATTPIEQKVWLYASSKHSEQTELRDLNVETMKNTARQNGLVVAGVSTDTSRQLSPMERPGVQEMLAAVREGRVGAVMMPSLHHLGRDFDAILPVLAEFQKQKVHIHAKDASALSLTLSPKPSARRKGGDAR